MSNAHGEPKGRIHDATHDGVTVGEADYVIVGSGAGGGAAARTLAKAGRSVVVLEDGPYVTADQVKVTAMEGMAHVLRHAGQSAAFGRAAVPVLQGRVVGGTTFVNSAIIWRTPEKVLAKWRQDPGLAALLTDADLDRAYTAVEAEMNVKPVSPDVESESDRRMKEGAEKAGIEHRTIRRSEKGCLGSARCLFGCPNRAKQSTAINYLARAVDDGAHVFAQAPVTKVEFEGTRAVGVRGRIGGTGPHAGREYRVRARRAVIVAASVVQSPNLLRRSGVAARSALGNHFMAHPGTALTGIYPHPVNMWAGSAQGYEAYGLRDTLGAKFESINVPPEVAASRLPGAGRRFGAYLGKLGHTAAWSIAVKTEAEGTVRPSRLFGGDFIRYQVTKNDLDKFRKGLRRLAEMHFLAGATEVLPNVFGPPDVLTGIDQAKLFDDAPLDPQSYSLVATHLFGTCRAGSDPRDAVVDASLKVHGHDGLYVMDASVFPSNTGVNPQHGIMALVTLAAERLASA